jgi:hypothetical protein
VFVLPTDKDATSHSQISRCHEVTHKALISVGTQISFLFPKYKLFFRMHIYQHGSVAHMQRHMVYQHFDYLRIADATESQSQKTATSLTNYCKCC